MTVSYPIEGSCQCGKVTYKLYEPPQMVLACHCTECQKLSSSPFSVTAIISASTISFAGELKEWSRLAEDGSKNSAKFCPNCGNRIYHFNPEDQTTLRLKLKPIHMVDASIFEPTVHIWVSEKLSWYHLPEGVEVFAKQP